MIQVETSLRIERPLADVYAFACDNRHRDQWQFRHAAVGLESAAFLASGVTAETNWLPPMQRRSNGLFEFDAVYHFEAADKQTLVTWTCQLRATAAYHFVEPLIGQWLVREAHLSLQVLGRLVAEASKPGSVAA